MRIGFQDGKVVARVASSEGWGLGEVEFGTPFIVKVSVCVCIVCVCMGALQFKKSILPVFPIFFKPQKPEHLLIKGDQNSKMFLS